jgi:SWI/SNF-related matrix-associated actin-dependent regulator of chromatin subfamily A-like protein 1
MKLREVQGRNPRAAIIVDDKKRAIQIHFPFDMEIVSVVRDISDRRYDNADKKWSVPVSPWHCAAVIRALKPLGFFIDPEIIKCADAKAEKPNLRKLLPDDLYQYQKDGVEFIYAARGRAIVGDDMGLGKTAEALVFTEMFGGNRVLIVAPANVLWKWALKEVPMWAKGMSVQVIESSKQVIQNRDITIMSYGMSVTRYDELAALPFDTIIYDEAHYLKSNKSQRNRVARKLVKGVPHLLFLTGTAFKNKRIEMFQLLHMLDPKQWSNVIEFGKRYCGGQFAAGHWIVPPEGETNTEELQERLAPIFLRRTKKQVGNQLPDLTRSTIPLYLDNQVDYEKTLRDLKTQARKEGYKPALALTILNKLRQVVGLGKIKAAIELAEDIIESGEQVVLFAYHKEVVAQLKQALWQHSVGVINGDTKPKDRQALADEFLSNIGLIKKHGLKVMIISSAGREGIDLFSSSHLIMAERMWTPADEEQIEARLHRNGQKNAVTAHYLVAKGTVDEKLDEIVRGKRSEFANLIETDIIREIYITELLDF